MVTCVSVKHRDFTEESSIWLIVNTLAVLTGLAIYILILMAAIQMYTYYELYLKKKLAPVLAAEDHYNRLVARLEKELDADEDEISNEIFKCSSEISGLRPLRSSGEINEGDFSDLSDDESEELEAKFKAAIADLQL